MEDVHAVFGTPVDLKEDASAVPGTHVASPVLTSSYFSLTLFTTSWAALTTIDSISLANGVGQVLS
jgi:hypothetical protein